MWLTVGAIIVSISAVTILRSRAQSGMNRSALGWMSEQWLAEQRRSHSA